MLNWFNEIQITRRRNKGVGTLDGQDFDTTLNKRTGNLCKLSGIVGQQGAWNYLHYTCNSLVGAEAIKLVVTKYFVKMSTLLLPWCLPLTRIWCIYIYIHCWCEEGFVRVKWNQFVANLTMHAGCFVRMSAWVISADICFDRFHFALLLFYKVYEGLKYTHKQFNVSFILKSLINKFRLIRRFGQFWKRCIITLYMLNINREVLTSGSWPWFVVREEIETPHRLRGHPTFSLVFSSRLRRQSREICTGTTLLKPCLYVAAEL